VEEIGGRLWVTYAAHKPGPFGGVVDVFDTDGHLLTPSHFAANAPGAGPLESPWGIVQAPADFGAFSNDILIGNVEGAGNINAFDPATGAYLGPLTHPDGTPVAIAGLWDLTFGGDSPANGLAKQLYFNAGPNAVSMAGNGLFGRIIAAGRGDGPGKTISVLVNGDRVAEPNGTFVVNLSGATNATIANAQGVGTILDDEPRISISDVTKAEGKKGQTKQFTFTVTLSAAYDQAVTVSYQTVNGTATTGDGDYVAKSGTLTFAPGERTKTITVEVKGDNKREANELFYLDLFGNSNSWITRSRGIGTILNDD
jgi:hypothetical protein